MRIDQAPNLPRPASPSPGAIEGAGGGKANDLEEPKSDAFEPMKRTSWSDFIGAARRTLRPKVMQARIDGAAPPGPAGGSPLTETIFHCADKLPKDEKHNPIRALYAEAAELAKTGEPGQAAEKLERALSRYEEEIGASKAMKNGGIEGTRNLAAQYRVLEEMKARGVEASMPPTKGELKTYFKTFDKKSDRPAATGAFERYAEAFYVHPANVGRPDEDINYSPDPTKYALEGKLYSKNDDAEKAQAKKGGTIYDITTSDASEWKDVSTDRDLVGVGGSTAHAAGKRVIDCEGYAYLAEELLGAAGYKHEQVAVQSKSGEQHAMTVLTDPARKNHFVVVSNDGVHSAAKKKDALDAGFKAAMPEGAEAGPYFYGRSQHEAQVKMMFHHI